MMKDVKKQFEEGTGGISGMLERLGGSISSVGSQLTLMTAPLAAIGAVGVKTAADFDSAMTEISARTGLVGDDLEKVRQTALKLGADTIFSGQQAADSFLNLLTAGMSTEQALQALPSILNAAAASGEDLGTTADGITSILASFGMEADQTSAVVEALSRAAGASKASMGSLSEGFVKIGPVAKQFGISMGDTAGMLAVLAQNGISGAEAGTQLKSMLLNMSRPTDEVRGAWETLGVSLYDTEGNIRNMDTVIRELDASLDTKTPQEQNELMQKLGGSYGIVGLSALRASGGISKMLSSMGEQASAADVAATMMDTFKNTIGSLQGSFETLMITALTPFMNNVLKPMAQQVIEIVNKINDWAIANPEVTNTIVRLLSVLTSIGPILFGVGKGISIIGTVIGLVMSPIGLITAAVAALWMAFSTNFLGIRDLVQPIIYQIQDGITYLGRALGGFVDDVKKFGLGDAILAAFGMGDAAKNAEGWFEDLIASFLGASEESEGPMRELSHNISQSLGNVAQFVIGTVIPALQQFANWFLSEGLPAIVGFVQNTVIPAIQQFFDFIGQAWAIIQPALVQLFNWFMNEGLPAIVGFVQNTVLPAIQGFFSFISQAWALVGPALSQLFNWFMNEGLPAVVGFIQGTVLPAVQNFFNFIAGAWAVIGPALSQFFNWFMSEGLPGIVGFIQGTVLPIVQEFFNFIGAVWANVQPALASIFDWFTLSALPAIANFIQYGVLPWVERFFNFIGAVWTLVQPALASIYNWFVTEGMPAISGFISGTVVPVVEGLFNFLAGTWTLVSSALGSIYDWFVANGLPAIQKVIETVKGIVDGFIGVLRGIWETVRPGVEAFASGIKSLLQPIIDLIEGILGKIADIQGNAAALGGAGQAAGAIAEGLNKGEYGIGDVIGGFIRSTASEFSGGAIPAYATGTDYVPETGLALVHEGEKITPASENNGSSGVTVNIQNFHATTEAEGRAAARGLKDELDELRRLNG